MPESNDRMSIAELARQAGVTVRTIRFYVGERVLPPPAGAGPRRSYDREHLLRLEAVHRLKERYYPLAEIRRTLDGRSLEEIRALLADLSGEVTGLGAVGGRELRSTRPGPVARSRLGQEERQTASPLGYAEVLRGSPDRQPVEATWRRVCLASDVELHFRPSADLARSAAIRRLVEEAVRLLGTRLDSRGGSEEP